MKRLTNKEKEIMDLYWQHGPMFVKELLDYYDEPKPHFNTLSTSPRWCVSWRRTDSWITDSSATPTSTSPLSRRRSTGGVR